MAAESSNTNSKEVINIKLNPTLQLRQSMASLCSADSNGMGRLDITGESFEITVRNAETNVVLHLCLNRSDLIEFKCNKHITGKLIHVAYMGLILYSATSDDDTFTILHLDGSDKLTLILGSDPDYEHNVRLYDMNVEIERLFPAIAFCEAVLTSSYLREIIRQLKETEISQEVKMEIDEKRAAFSVGGESEVLVHYFKGVKRGAGTRGLELGQKAQACIIMHHLEALEIASKLEEHLMLCFHLQPDQLVRMRFGLQGLCYLEFVYTATRVVTNINPERVISFQLKLDAKLTSSLLTLFRSKLNPRSFGRLDITKNGGFEITVHNTQSNAVIHFRLNCRVLIDFECTKPIIGKTINVEELSDLVALVELHTENRFLTIYHLDGSNKLTCRQGTNPVTDFNFILDEEILRIPVITFLCDCEGVIEHEHLRELAEQLQNSDTPSKKVLVNIDEKYVWLSVPGENFLRFTTYKPEEVVESRRAEPDQMHSADFIMHHSKVLTQVSDLPPRPLVSVLSEPDKRVMIRFCLEELGELVFVYNATSVVKKRKPLAEEEGTGSHNKKGSGSHDENGSGSKETTMQPE